MDIFICSLFALAGGFAINILRACELNGRPKKERDIVFNDHLYWIQFVFTPIAGWIITLAYLTSGIKLNAIVSMQIGASSPLILKSFASAVPPVIPAKSID
jgi:hypothetical protein